MIPGGFPKRFGAPERIQAVAVRAVVLQVEAVDEQDPVLGPRAAVYCRVLTYATNPDLRGRVIPRVLVTYPTAGLHDGDVWLPRPSTRTARGFTAGDLSGISPAELDGDHVVVAFLEGNPTQPYLQRALPHPNADARALSGAERWGGQRLRPVNADAAAPGVDWHPARGVRHAGAFFGVDGAGNFVVDLREAHGGALGSKLEAPGHGGPALATDGTQGNVRLVLRTGSDLELDINGATLKVELADGAARLTLGDGVVAAAVSQHLEALYGQLAQWLATHTHTYAFGPTLVPDQAAALPAWDRRIESDKLLIPDRG